MDWSFLKFALPLALLIIVVSLWLVWKFFFKLFKYFIVALVIVLIGAGMSVYRMQPQKNPAIGKHAYLTDSGHYLGVVEGSGEDNRRGEVWIIRPPGGYPVMYRKSRVTLKDRIELKKESKEEPIPSPKAEKGKSKAGVEKKQ